MGFLLLLVKNFLFLESKLTPFLLISFFNILVWFFSPRGQWMHYHHLKLMTQLQSSWLCPYEKLWGPSLSFPSWPMRSHLGGSCACTSHERWSSPIWTLVWRWKDRLNEARLLCACISQRKEHIVSSLPHPPDSFDLARVHLAPLQ